MGTNVKPHPPRTSVDPVALRTYLARHCISRTDVARRYGCSHQYISAALASDRTEKPVSQHVLLRIRNIAAQLIWEREL